MGRVVFNSDKIRNDFFGKTLEVYDCITWNRLSNHFGICRKLLHQYRVGRLTIPENLYKKIIKSFSKSDLKMFSKNISFRESNWGNIKGGKKAYIGNKSFFDEGRKKAILLSKMKIKKFDINLPLTEDLAYFMGLFIGDGFTNKYQRYYLTQFVGQYSFEEGYYRGIISRIGRDLFGLVLKIKKEKNSDTVRANYYSRDLFEMITKRFKISRGRKSHFVLIPEEILNSDEKIVFSCIAGLYDAEGCFYFVERNGYKNPYPILEFHVNNVLLVNQINQILINAGVKFSSWKNKRIVIYGKKNISYFFKKIKLKNPKLLRKVPKVYF